MARRTDRSPQTVAVLEALSAAGKAADGAAAGDRSGAAPGPGWHHGYDLARPTGLTSGTLYPILARLADRGFLERRWEDPPPRGRPPRHLYRLTPLGEELVEQVRRESRRTAPVRSRPAPSTAVAGGPA